MEFWVSMALAILFQLIKDKKQSAQFRAALAKLYVQIGGLAMQDEALATLIGLKREQ